MLQVNTSRFDQGGGGAPLFAMKDVDGEPHPMSRGAKTRPKPYPLLGTGQTPLWAVFTPDVETCPCRPPINRLQPHGWHLPLGIGRARSDLWID